MTEDDGDYFVSIELRRRDSNPRVASISVTQESIDAFETIGQDALVEAIENAVVRMRIAIQEEVEHSKADLATQTYVEMEK